MSLVLIAARPAGAADGETDPAAAAESEELLPLGGELPDEDDALAREAAAHPASLRYGIAYAHDSLSDPRRRGYLDLARWGLASRALYDPRGEETARGGAVYRRGAWFIGAGRLGGGWGGRLVLARRRRSRLGVVPRLGAGRDGRELPDLRPSTSADPLVQGLAAGGRVGPLTVRVCRLGLFAPPAEPADETGQGLGLAWRRARFDLFLTDALSAAACGWRLRRESLEVGLEGAHARGAESAGGRSALSWRAHYEAGALRVAGEALAVAGAEAPSSLLEGWLTGPVGHEVHIGLSGAGPLGSAWRFARRHRTELGLGDGGRRRETGLTVRAPVRGGRLEVSARQVTDRSEPEVASAPGFPRRVSAGSVGQECVVDWRGAWRVRWAWRGDEEGSGLLLTLSGRPWAAAGPGLLRPLLLDFAVFATSAEGASFTVFSGGGLYRRVESLGGGDGWRCALKYPVDRGPLALRPGLCLTHEPGDAPWRFAFWLECRCAH